MGSKLVKQVALWVLPDEPAWGLIEASMMVPGPNGSMRNRWIQQIKVIRDDKIAYYTEDFGPAENFERVTPLLMPSVGTDTVAELQEHAAKNRQDFHWSDRTHQMLADSTLIVDAIQHLEQEREARLNRSVIGPAIAVQRNDTPREALQSLARDQKKRRKDARNRRKR